MVPWTGAVHKPWKTQDSHLNICGKSDFHWLDREALLRDITTFTVVKNQS